MIKMVKSIVNDSAHDLSYEEHLCILECSKMIHKAFGRKVFKIVLTGEKTQLDQVFGISFNLDQFSVD